MQTQTSHPVNMNIDLTVVTGTSGQWAGYAVIHRAGCNHTFRKNSQPRPIREDWTEYADDFYAVAPCAKAK